LVGAVTVELPVLPITALSELAIVKASPVDVIFSAPAVVIVPDMLLPNAAVIAEFRSVAVLDVAV